MLHSSNCFQSEFHPPPQYSLTQRYLQSYHLLPKPFGGALRQHPHGGAARKRTSNASLCACVPWLHLVPLCWRQPPSSPARGLWFMESNFPAASAWLTGAPAAGRLRGRRASSPWQHPLEAQVSAKHAASAWRCGALRGSVGGTLPLWAPAVLLARDLGARRAVPGGWAWSPLHTRGPSPIA